MTAGAALGLDLSKGLAYVANEFSGLVVVDISDPTNPIQVGQAYTDIAHGVHVAGGFSYLAAGDQGLLVVQLPPVDLSIRSIAPIQVLEGQALVKNKPTAVKVIIKKTGSGVARDVSVRLSDGSNSYTRFYVAEAQNIYDEPPYALIQDNREYPLDFSTAEAEKFIYFFSDNLAPASATLNLSAKVDYSGAIDETDEANNDLNAPSQAIHDTHWPADGWFPNLFLYYFRVDWLPIGGYHPISRFDDFYQASNSFFSAIYPVSPGRFKPDKSTLYVRSTFLNRGLDGKLDEIELIWFLWPLVPELKLAHPTADGFVAVVPEGWFAQYGSGKLAGKRGAAYPGLPIVVAEVVVSSHPNGPITVLHEVGHQFGLRVETEEYDDAGSDDPGWGNYADIGMWVDLKLPILPLDPGGVIGDLERGIWCFMGKYQDPAEYWIDADDYSGLLTNSAASTALNSPEQGGAPAQAILAMGTLKEGGEITLDDWFTLPQAELSALAPGPYAFEYYDGQGHQLFVKSFDISTRTGYISLSEAPFAYTIPYIDGTARIAITHNGTPIAQKPVSRWDPTITLLAPNGGEQITASTTIRWSAEDGDGDKLTFAILVSADDGSTWETLASRLDQTQFTWEVAGFPPGNRYRVKVVGTDGFNTARDSSDGAFTIYWNVYLPHLVK